MTPTFYLGLDIGQRHDYTALSILERQPQDSEVERRAGRRYTLGHLERWRHTTFQETVDRTLKVERKLMERGDYNLPLIERNHRLQLGTFREVTTSMVIDQTGCGQSVPEMFNRAGAQPVGIIITGGTEHSRLDTRRYGVPKRDLIYTLIALLESGRLLIPSKLPLRRELLEELQVIERKQNEVTGYETFTHRSGTHDDLVLSVAIAAWYAEQHKPSVFGMQL